MVGILKAHLIICGILIELGISGMEVEDNVQLSQEDKEKLSHVIHDNSGSLEELYEQIDINLERVHNEIKFRRK